MKPYNSGKEFIDDVIKILNLENPTITSDDWTYLKGKKEKSEHLIVTIQNKYLHINSDLGLRFKFWVEGPFVDDFSKFNTVLLQFDDLRDESYISCYLKTLSRYDRYDFSDYFDNKELAVLCLKVLFHTSFLDQYTMIADVIEFSHHERFEAIL